MRYFDYLKHFNIVKFVFCSVLIPFFIRSRSRSSADLDDPKANAKMKNARVGCLYAVAYSVNLGGTGALTSTAPNLVLMGIL